MYSALFGSALFFIVLPYIGPSGILPTDIQPWGVVFAVLAVCFRINQLSNLMPKLFIPVFLIFTLASASAAINMLLSPHEGFLNLRAFWGYFTAFIILVYIYLYRNEALNMNLIAYIVDLCLIVILIGFFLQAAGYNNVVQAVTSRAVFDFDRLAARGFTSFHPEQSRVSEQMLLYLVIYLLIGKLNAYRCVILLVFSILSFAGQFFVSLMQLILALTLSYGIFLFNLKQARLKRLPASILIIVMISVFFFYGLGSQVAKITDVPTRFTTALSLVSESPFSVLEDRNAQIKFSGFLYAIIVPVANPLEFDILADTREKFRTDVYATSASFSRDVLNVPLYRTARPYTAIGQWGIHFGMLGLIILISFLVFLFKSCCEQVLRSGKFNVLIAFFILAQLSLLKLPLANPTLWFAVGLLIVVISSTPRRDYRIISQTRVGWTP